jgi:general secretion pathway protein I
MQRNRRSIRSACSSRRGLSLLEVLLSVAILGMALVAIGQLVKLGYQSATDAKLQTEAYIICDAKMAEVVAGVLPLESAGAQAVEENPDWSFAVEVNSSDRMGLLRVRVRVEQSENITSYPISYSIDRFVPDPDYDPAENSVNR